MGRVVSFQQLRTPKHRNRPHRYLFIVQKDSESCESLSYRGFRSALGRGIANSTSFSIGPRGSDAGDASPIGAGVSTGSCGGRDTLAGAGPPVLRRWKFDIVAGMSQTLLLRLSAGVLLLAGSWLAYTQNPNRPPSNKLNKISDDLYEIEGDGGKVAFYITNEGVILIDDKFEYDFNDIVDKIKSVTNQPVKYVLNTHHHGDHTGSNAKFLPTAEIISHVNARKNMIDGKQPGPPRITFTQETEVFLGGKEVRARYFGRGHTNGDVMIYFPALKVLHTGDLMAGNSPLIDYGGGGSLLEWTATLDAALKLDFDTVIPGHGPIAKKADMLAYRNNIEKFQNRVSGMIRQGAPKDDIAKMLTAEYGWAPSGLQMTRGFEGMLTELKR